MKDQRKAKIRQLKTKLKEAQDNLISLITDDNSKKEERTEEEQKNYSKSIADFRTEISNTQEELNEVRRNKYSSSFFEFIPTPGANRQQRRARRNMKRL